MDFVDLDRLFVPLKRDTDAAIEWGPSWGLKYGGWLDWPGVLQRWRVVLLAEALSGKTKELEHRAVALRREGKPAFFLRIEDLADDSVEASLSDDDKAAFHSWAAADAGEAWFFLDSVDEARLNGKKLATAFRNVRAALSSGNLNRAHIIVSCRVSDWKGKADRESLQKELPYVPPVESPSAVTDPDEILLSPMFDRTSRSTEPKKPQTEPNPGELLVVQLAPLNHEQQARMATAASITNVPGFMQAVRLSGLETMGDLNVERIDFRAAWMFSSPSLARAVRRAWEANDRLEFRMHLLEFIEEGRIKECVDLARKIALDSSANQWHRLTAARALLVCDDPKGLKDLARVVRAAPDRFSARLAPQLASLLYPAYLSTDDLLDLVDRSESPEPYQSEGFSYQLVSLHALAPTRDAQRQFALGIADLILKAPHIEDSEVSSRHFELGRGLAALAKAELERRAIGDVDDGLIRLLMATERARGVHDDEDELGALAARVHQDKALNRQLMWADAQTDRRGRSRDTPPVNIWQVGPHTGFVLWRTDISDLEWLQEDARRMPEEYERRIAFSAVLSALHGTDRCEPRLEFLDLLAAGDSALEADLADYRKPARVAPYAADAAARKERAAKETQEAKKSWTDFRDQLKSTPAILDTPEAVKSWKAGLRRLYDLTNWVEMKARYDGVEGAAKWQALPLAFGSEVAEHYARAMLLTWRKVRPERPKKIADNQFTRNKSNQLAVRAVGLDSLTPRWEHNLSDDEVAIAVRHACFAGTIRAEWVNRLVTARPNAALPEITSAVATEYRSDGTYSDIISSASHADTPALQAIATEVLRLLRKSEPVDDATLDRSLQVLRRGIAGLPAPQVRALVLKRVHLHLAAANERRALQYLGALADIDPEELAKIALSKLERGASEIDQDYAERVSHWLGALFAGQGEHGVATSALAKMPVAHLARLLRLAYEHIAARDWAAHRSGSGRSPSDKAESARGMLFNAIAERPGAEAYDALLALSADPVFADSSLRLREIAHARAESDGDLPTWLATEVTKFEQSHSAPVKTGAQLLTLTLGVLADIEASFSTADASSRQLLALAQDEKVVQGWLAERLNERARGRYSAARESEVADRNEPDILVSSTSADVQVAIEVKNGNKKWTVTQLEGAVRGQLAKDYLRPANRRDGILVVSLHRRRTWRVLGEEWDFARLIEHLTTVAQATKVNDSGPVQLAVVGINASRETPSSAKRPSRKRRSTT